MNKGYIYILVNPSMPNMVKIGKTQRSSDNRASELSTGTNVPFHFEVGYEKLVSDCHLAEQIIHKKLSAFRVNRDREFFSIRLREAINVVNKIILDEKLSLEEREVWDYDFNDSKYSNLNQLVLAFVKNKKAFEDSFIHIEKGYIEKWLESIRNFDHLILFQKLKEQYPGRNDFLVIHLLFQLNNTISFSLFGRDLNCNYLISIISKYNKNMQSLSEEEKVLIDLIDSYWLHGSRPRYIVDKNQFKLHQYYSIFENIRGIYDEKNEVFFKLIERDYYRIDDIKKVIKWYEFSNEYYFNRNCGSLEPEEILKLKTINEIEEYERKYYLPIELTNKIKSQHKVEMLQGIKILENYGSEIHPYLKRGLLQFEKEFDYRITEERMEEICYLDIDGFVDWMSYYKFKRDLPIKLEDYYIPSSIIEGMRSTDEELAQFCHIVLFFFSYGHVSYDWLFDRKKNPYNVFISKYEDSKSFEIKKIIKDLNKYIDLVSYYLISRIIIKLFEQHGEDVIMKEKGKFFLGINLNDISRFYLTALPHHYWDGFHFFIKHIDLDFIENFSAKYVQTFTPDFGFNDVRINKIFWFIHRLTFGNVLNKNKLESCIFPETLLNKFKNEQLTSDEHKKYSNSVFPYTVENSFFNKNVIPSCVTNKVLSQDINIFISGLISFNNLKEFGLISKKTARYLSEEFIVFKNIETQLLNLNEDEYKQFIKLLEHRGIIYSYTGESFDSNPLIKSEKLLRCFNNYITLYVDEMSIVLLKKGPDKYSILRNGYLDINLEDNNRDRRNMNSEDKKAIWQNERKIYETYKSLEWQYIKTTVWKRDKTLGLQSEIRNDIASINLIQLLKSSYKWIIVDSHKNCKPLPFLLNSVYNNYLNKYGQSCINKLFTTYNLSQYTLMEKIIEREISVDKMEMLRSCIDIIQYKFCNGNIKLLESVKHIYLLYDVKENDIQIDGTWDKAKFDHYVENFIERLFYTLNNKTNWKINKYFKNTVAKKTRRILLQYINSSPLDYRHKETIKKFLSAKSL